MAGKFIPTRNSFILTCTNVWKEVAHWTEWQSVWQTSNCFDLTVSFTENDRDPVEERFLSAAINGDVSLVERLLQEGVPVDCAVDEVDYTALSPAAQFNRTDVIRLLLQKGADVNKRDHYGDTFVHYAAITNSTEVIALLIEHGASINITNNEGEKPIDKARRLGKKAAVRMLEQL